MASRSEAHGILELKGSDAAASTAANADSVDALVTDFLAQLSDIASEVKPARTAPPFESHRIGNMSPSHAPYDPQTAIPMPPEAATANETANLESINREIEATLDEVERRRSARIPATGSGDSMTQPPLSAAGNPMGPVPESSNRQIVQRTSSHPASKAVEQEWKRIDLFRTGLNSTRSNRRRRNIFIILVAILMAALLMYFYYIGRI